MGKLLTAAQVEQYHRDGILFPVPVLSPGETARFRAAFEDVAARLGGRPVAQALGHTHAYFRWAYDLATHPRILDAVEDVLGPDLLVWTVSIFPKYPRDPGYISWHQDGTYWGLDSTRVMTAWVALTDSTLDNGCMRVMPGSHRRPILPHRDTYAADNRLSRGQEIEVEVDEQDALDVVLRAGEMSLHHVNITHGSNPNPSDGSRIGFAPRCHDSRNPADRRRAAHRGAGAGAGRPRTLPAVPGAADARLRGSLLTLGTRRAVPPTAPVSWRCTTSRRSTSCSTLTHRSCPRR